PKILVWFGPGRRRGSVWERRLGNRTRVDRRHRARADRRNRTRTRGRPAPTSKIYDVSFWTSQNRPVHFPYLGYKLANEGHDTRGLQAYLGHKNIQHTVRYTELAPTRFKGWWKD